MGNAAAKAQRLMLGNESGSTHRQYIEKAALMEILKKEGKPVRLVKPQYLIDLYEKSEKPIARRQELPEEAFLHFDALSEKQIGGLVIVAVSYCWISKAHPDPSRYHLKTLWALLKLYMDYGGDLRDRSLGMDFTAGVFLDWASLHQEPRSEEEALLFKDALKNINSWYAHSQTLVWKLTSLPEDIERAGYADSGWPFFESEVARIIKPVARIRTFSASMREKLIAEACREQRSCLAWSSLWEKFAGEESIIPLEPECFDSRVERKHFTNGADCDCVVKPKYEATFRDVISGGTDFVVENSPASGSEALEAVRVWAKHCFALRTIKITRCESLDLDMHDLVGALSQRKGRAEGLETLSLTSNPKLNCRLDDLAPLKGLRRLVLQCCSIGGDVSDLARLTSLRELVLGGVHGLSGDISSLAKLPELQKLEIDDVQGLSGDLCSLAQSVKLQRLALFNLNGLGGEVGSLAQLPKLQELTLGSLGSQGLGGDISSLVQLVSLEKLSLAHSDRLIGDISCLGELAKLREVDLFCMHGLSGTLNSQKIIVTAKYNKNIENRRR